jgi:hypothetical protein
MTISHAPPDTECTVMASKLPLRSFLHIPRFLRWTLRIRRQLADAEGLVGYSLDAHLLRRTFWTASAWTDPAALRAFSGANPHRDATTSIRPMMLPSTFVFWTCPASDLPVRWDEVRRRVAGQEGAQVPSEPG